jgi:predicted tellurium resistance membrane protein TerC
MILLAGGLFLIYKATVEIHHRVDADSNTTNVPAVSLSVAAVLGQILVMDLIFSVDSVITAVGMSDKLVIMMLANVVALIVMLLAASSISKFIDLNPTVKMLALAFLVLIGTVLVAEAFHVDVPKGYIYFAMAFSTMVEMLNIRSRRHSMPMVVEVPAEVRTQRK